MPLDLSPRRPSFNIRHYDAKIWATADRLRSLGVKGSDFPKHMMPFFVLRLAEAFCIIQHRAMLRLWNEQERQHFGDYDPSNEEHREVFRSLHGGRMVNPGIIMDPKGKLLADMLSARDAMSLLPRRLEEHLLTYSEEFINIVGLPTRPVEGSLGMHATVERLREDGALGASLASYLDDWAAVDMSDLDVSDIVTLTEQIKRRWGELQADQAGDHYTPSDLIRLSAKLAERHIRRLGLQEGRADILDPTCGGCSLLFGTENYLRAAFPNISLTTFGQDFNPESVALARAQALFREEATICLGNTLTSAQFLSKLFTWFSANPPFGVDWKNLKAYIESLCGQGVYDSRFLPPTSDGQALFAQLCLHVMDPKNGGGFLITSGSSLFSGDAGRGESNWREEMLLRRDAVEAIIQLPKNMFYNTGIQTYAWVFSADKARDPRRRGKVAFINAEGMGDGLKKNLGKKSVEFDDATSDRLVALIEDFRDTPECRIVEVSSLAHQEVEILVTRQDEEGRSMPVQPLDHWTGKVFLGDDLLLDVRAGSVEGIGSRILPEEDLTEDMNPANTALLANKALGGLDSGLLAFCAEDGHASFSIDLETGEARDGEGRPLGLGQVRLRVRVGKVGRGAGAEERLLLDAQAGPLREKDRELAPWSADEEEAEELRLEHLRKWVSEPHEILGFRSGLKANFNTMFPSWNTPRASRDILAELARLDGESA